YEKSLGTAAHRRLPESLTAPWIGAMARLPASNCCLKIPVVLPMGVTIPIPVTATCSIGASFMLDRVALLGLHEASRLRRRRPAWSEGSTYRSRTGWSGA